MPSAPNHDCSIKSFGASVDASDDTHTLQLKHAAMDAQANGIPIAFSDPYDAIVHELTRLDGVVEAGGRFDVPSWLHPIPRPSDRPKITKDAMAGHVANRGMLALCNQVKDFIHEAILPATPLMIGVDHSITGGVIAALSEKLGPENLSVIICDQHFDGLPLSLRLDPRFAPSGLIDDDMSRPGVQEASDDEYCCGNFIKHLADSGTILFSNLFLIGVADYPGDQCPLAWLRFKENYLDYEKRGCHFFPQTAFGGDYFQRLKHFIDDQITTPYVYVSLDMDVGAYRCVHAARYMDTMGIDKKALMDVARIIAEGCRDGKYCLAGMDAVEFNVHFLGLEYAPGKRDETLSVALDFFNMLLSTHTEPYGGYHGSV